MYTIIEASELPVELEGFAGGMGYKSIQHITEAEVGCEGDVKGYISQPVDGIYYAEILGEGGAFELYVKSDDISELQKLLSDKIYEYCTQ